VGLLVIGDRYGRGVVVRENIRVVSGRRQVPGVLLRCDDGTMYTARADHLKAGKVNSCGCLRREQTPPAGWKHGLAAHPLYWTWRNMLRYHRAETIPEWRHIAAFVATCDLGRRPPGMRMMRIDASKPYGPGNVEWVTRSEVTRRGWPKRKGGS
jgi:hypothetical protein